MPIIFLLFSEQKHYHNMSAVRKSAAASALAAAACALATSALSVAEPVRNGGVGGGGVFSVYEN